MRVTRAHRTDRRASRPRAARRSLPILLAGLAVLAAPRAEAAVVVLDENTPGASRDAIIDGFPGIAPLDGVGDVGGNSLAVGLKAGVSEERAVVELPLAGLAGATVTSATLTFNIDDVLSTFGPGTDFDGTAADPIYVAVYAGDGAAALDDFARGTRVATVSTGGAGITDATLPTSGPVVLDVDLTGALQQLLDQGATHLGLVFSTDDSPTGTSIDDLGVGAAGPPGVGGARLPFVTVETSGGPLPTPTPGGATPTPAPTPTPQPTNPGEAALIQSIPDGSGDQLVFYFDARDSFTTFLNLTNVGGEDVSVSLLLYAADLAGEPFEEILSLAPGATRTIDVGALRDDGLAASPGVAFATGVDAQGAPIVTRALAGNFTVANLETGSAWGAPAAARSAVALGGGGVSQPPLGTPIDGASVLLRAIRPDRLSLAVYYDPATLEPAAKGGNQVIFLSFNDVPGAVFDVTAAPTTWALDASRNDGTPLDPAAFTASGVDVSDLESLLGPEVNGAAGSLLFAAEPPGAYNRLVYFTESLGTFSTGYLLPVAP